jgi:hypothetical protein
MTASTQERTTPVGVVSAAREVLSDLDDVLWAAKEPTQLLAVKKEIERLSSQVAAVDAKVCTEIEISKAAQAEEWASPADYITAVSGGRRGHGQRWLRTSRALTSDRARTLDALGAGDISVDHATVICSAIAKLPVKKELRDLAERHLLEAAAICNATELKEFAAELLERIDPDGSERRDEAALKRDERSAHLDRHLSITEDGLGGVKLRGRGTIEDAAVIKAALVPLAAPRPAGQPEDPTCDADGRDPRDHGTRMWDALVELSQRSLDSETLPTAHGAKPRVTITIDFERMRGQVGPGILDTGEALSASAVRRLCCDADITLVVLGSRSEVLDVGRMKRLVTGPIWTALVARDRHCSFPGCRRPPIACDAHHIQHWVDGGDTSLDNMCLLCGVHHTMIHNTPWRVRLNPADRRPEFVPPRHLDPDQRPIRDRRPRD